MGPEADADPIDAGAGIGNIGSTIYLTSFQNIEWQKQLTGEIYSTWSNTPGAQQYFNYCVDKSASLPVPGVYYIEV